MKSRPILFSAPMVRALLEGRKTQTRRIVKPQDSIEFDPNVQSSPIYRHSARCPGYCDYGCEVLPCPYGAPGDTLWVREEHYVRGHWEPVEGVRTKQGRMKWRFVAADDVVRFDAPDEYRKGRHHKDSGAIAWHKRLARFMPRWASRITLEVTGVRVERLQTISQEDARAEGLKGVTKDGALVKYGLPDRDGWPGTDDLGWEWREWEIDPRRAFHRLWESINGERSWAANPWVWAISFRVVTP